MNETMTMGMKTVSRIAAPVQMPKLKRVAAYARVSMGKDAMLHSLAAQVSYYSDLIQRNPEWEYAGVYADEGLTGTKENRPEFQRMLSDCRAGKIDMILVKSISRFARNTVTLLETVRVLKEMGISVYFEEQKIDTMSGDGELIKSKEHTDNWQFVDVYTDKGITGTSTKKREGFNRMIQDALAGKIDLIITKSVSRFARNTVDTLTTIRKLKEHGVEVYFEEQNIYTLDGKGEVLLTIMSSIAQEESRNISENVTWGMRKRFAEGKVTMAYKQFMGYRKGKNGIPEIVEAEAKIIRSIFRRFLEGATPAIIARELNLAGIPCPSRKSLLGEDEIEAAKARKKTARWSPSTIESILTNEKYKGDAILQKTYCTDYINLYRKMQIRLCEEYQKNRSDEPGVHFDNIAVLCLGDYLSSVSVFALSEEEAWAQAVRLGTELLENNAQLQPEDSIQRAWDFTVDWIGSNREHFRGHMNANVTRYGSFSAEHVNIIQSVYRKALEDAGFSYAKSVKGFVSRGWFDSFIDADGKNRSQYQCKINGVNMRVFRCKLKVGADDSSEDDFLK